MNVNIRSKECAWCHGELKILGRTLTGLRGWEVKKTVEKEHLYGAGQYPIDITEGNVKVEGSIKVLGFEADDLNTAAKLAGYDDITSVPHELVVLSIKYQKTLVDRVTTIAVRGVSFTESGDSLEQGAKNREITLPFLAMDMEQLTI